MIVQGFEIVNGKIVDVMYGDYPDEEVDKLQVGGKIPLTINRPENSQVGTGGISKDLEIGEFTIVERHEKRTEINVPYIELILQRIS